MWLQLCLNFSKRWHYCRSSWCDTSIIRKLSTIYQTCYKNWWSNYNWCWRFRFSHVNVQSNTIKYNLIQSNYSETTLSLWFCSKENLEWSKYCVLSEAGNNENIIFTINVIKLYVPVVTLSARDNKKLSKRLSKSFERSVYLNE